MSFLGNDDIERNVRVLTDAFVISLYPKKLSASEEQYVKMGSDLLINLLQNLNDIAYFAQCEEDRRSRQ